MDRELQAVEYFMQGYNCAQAVVLAYTDVIGMDSKTCARFSSSFGGGMGRMREVCGAVSGMLMVAGMLYGYDTPEEGPGKKALYTTVQQLADRFRQETGSIICREILKNPPSDPNPSARTQEYYKKRPCARMVGLAVRVLEQYRQENPL